MEIGLSLVALSFRGFNMIKNGWTKKIEQLETELAAARGKCARLAQILDNVTCYAEDCAAERDERPRCTEEAREMIAAIEEGRPVQ